MKPADDLQEELRAGCLEEIREYENALRLAKDVVTDLERGEATTPRLAELQMALDRIANIEGQLTDSKRLWLAEKKTPNPDLAAAIDRMRRLIESITELVRRAEELAKAQKNRLLPEIDAAARSQQMRRAYGLWRP